jgi:hypothetical protein
MTRRVRVVRRRRRTDGEKAFNAFVLTVFLFAAVLRLLGVPAGAVWPIAAGTILIGLSIGIVLALISYFSKKG